MSHLCRDRMHVYLDEFLKGAKTEAQIKDAIIKAYSKLESEWVEFTSLAYKNGFPKSAYVGSCALIAIVVDNKLYVANSGDSKAVLLRQKGEDFESINVSRTFNANKKSE